MFSCPADPDDYALVVLLSSLTLVSAFLQVSTSFTKSPSSQLLAHQITIIPIARPPNDLNPRRGFSCCSPLATCSHLPPPLPCFTSPLVSFHLCICLPPLPYFTILLVSHVIFVLVSILVPVIIIRIWFHIFLNDLSQVCWRSRLAQ